MKKIFLKTLIGSLIISAILAILVILFGFDSDWGIQTLFTTLVIFPFSITGLCCSSISENEKVKWFSYIGIATNIIGCLMYIGLIWGLLDICLIFCEEDANLTWNLLGTFSTLSISFAHISTLLAINSTNKTVNISKKTTIIISAILDLLLLDGIWLNLIEYNEFTGKLVIILIILMVLGTVVSPLLHKATKKQEQKIAKEEPINKEIQITQLKCPNCNFEIKEDWKFCPNCNTNLKEK